MAVAARRERERHARRESILDAAEEVIVRVGYQALKMDDVARAAELSKGTLYLYFANKDALCAAIAIRNLDRLLPGLRHQETQAKTGLEAIEGLVRHYCEFTEETPSHFRFAIAWLSSAEDIDDSSDAFHEYRLKVGEVLTIAVESIVRGQADGSVRKDVDPLPTGLNIWTSMLGVVLSNLSRKSFAQRLPIKVDLDNVVQVHIDALKRSIGVPKGSAK